MVTDEVIGPVPHEAERWREAVTMALYVAIVVLTELVVMSDGTTTDVVVRLIWGTTIGLALAHWFAFSLSARLVRRGGHDRSDTALAIAQVLGAVAIAAIASVPLLVWPDASELDAVRTTLAGAIALVGFAVARSAGANVVRASIFAASVLLVAAVVVAIKNLLLEH